MWWWTQNPPLKISLQISFAVHHHIGGLEIVDNVLVVVLSVHHHIGGLESIRLQDS
jgi:molybdopterin synthase catalytic subunit